MRAIIKNDQVIDDQWTLLSAEADLAEALRT